MKLCELEIRTSSLICQIIAIFFLYSENSFAKSELCNFQEGILKNGNSLYSSGQNFLSTTQYSMLFNSDCEELSDKARYNYSLAMGNLGEVNAINSQLYYFSNTMNSHYFNDLKVVLDFHNTNTDNKKVNAWKNLNEGNIFSKLSIENVKLSDLQIKYLENNNVKSPYISGAMSALIPGAGQAYNGTYQSGVLAFVINAIFLWSALEFKKNNLDGPAIASGAVFSITYFGNIMNAINTSNKINENNSKVYKDEIREALFPELRPK